LKKRFIHLTNFSINKKAENYIKNTKGADSAGNPVESSSTAPDTEDSNEGMASKWSLV
jgi:hypothetical protein